MLFHAYSPFCFSYFSDKFLWFCSGSPGPSPPPKELELQYEPPCSDFMLCSWLTQRSKHLAFFSKLRTGLQSHPIFGRVLSYCCSFPWDYHMARLLLNPASFPRTVPRNLFMLESLPQSLLSENPEIKQAF
jgi:hypothetical protein